MGRVVVIEFVTLDGVVEDPDGRGGTPRGGWAFRFGPEAVAGDKFDLGEILESGSLLLGRKTWQLFSGIWPARTDDFSNTMNRIPKLVVSRSLDSVDGWSNSTVITGELTSEVRRCTQKQDVVVAGSVGIVETLMAHDLVDEYRLLVFPVVLGQGKRLFGHRSEPIDLALVSTEAAGAAVRLTYTRKPQA
jgi:dihydrofolate reductase